MYKSFLYKGIDKYIQIKRNEVKTCSTCIYHNNGICTFLESKKDTKTMITNKDLCGPYRRFYEKKSSET